MKPSEQSNGFRFFDNLERYRMCSYRITCIYTMVGNLFVDYLGVMDLTSKGKFINKDANKRCESKAQSYKYEARQPAPISPLDDKGHKYKCNDDFYKCLHNKMFF